ncbi:MAG: NAD-dependent epimerase/dehydratase family protein [Pseudomonadota bacterium]|nr:NAD-dependent epimerase/dehydratase family protein [Pseudomonadota bacterium]
MAQVERAGRVVVTGATGFLGGALVRRLHRLDPARPMTAIGRDRGRGDTLRREGICFSALDLSDASGTDAALADAEVVVHAAALSSPWGPRDAFHDANVIASEHVAFACARAGARRLVHISTPGIYHDGKPHLGIREDDALPARAVNHYAASKREAEHRVLAICAEHDLPVIILRPRAIFGPGDTSLLPRIAEALRRERLPRIGDGSCLIDMSYIDNVVDAVLLAMAAPTALSGRAYNISNGEPVRIWDVIDLLADALAVPRPQARLSRANALRIATVLESGHRLFAPRREPALLRYGVDLLSVDMALDISRARSELGYDPHIGMEDALARTFAGLQRLAS